MVLGTEEYCPTTADVSPWGKIVFVAIAETSLGEGIMAKELETIEQQQHQGRQKQPSREEIDVALARLEKIAVNLPPVDVVAIVGEGRDLVGNKNR